MPTHTALDLLTETERAILALLAEGHTAKSIAAELGRTESAVNERLREARRKTGVGSSRELARLVRRQENRDRQSGVAVDGRPATGPADAPLWAHWQGKMLLMTIPIATLVAAALALHTPVQEVASVPPASLAGGDVNASAAQMRVAFDAEARDPAWADRAAKLLLQRYRMVGGPDLATLSVECRKTLCTVRGQSMSDAGSPAGKRFSDALASPPFRSSVAGLHADVTDTSGFVRAGSYVVSFDAIWRRTSG